MRKPSKLREVICQICGNKFKTNHSRGKYCSNNCSHQGEKRSWIKYGNKNRQKRRDNWKRYYKNNRDKIIAKTTEYQKTSAGRLVVKISTKRQIDKFPQKYQARQEVLKALRKGIITKKSCEICGAIKVEAHHDDYGKPLKVRWLCPKHHHELKIKK